MVMSKEPQSIEVQRLEAIQSALGILSSQLQRLIEHEELKIPTGSKHISVTASTTTKQIPIDPPWISFTIINDSGANGVYYGINEEADLLDTTVVDAGESRTEDMIHPKIYMLYLKAESGTAAVRIHAVEGKKKLL